MDLGDVTSRAVPSGRHATASESGGDGRRDPVAGRATIRHRKCRKFGDILDTRSARPEVIEREELVERATGIEPVSEAWEASVLPLY